MSKEEYVFAKSSGSSSGFSIGEQDLYCEQVSRDDAETSFVVRIEYERGPSARVDLFELDVDSRMEVTEVVAAQLDRAYECRCVERRR